MTVAEMIEWLRAFPPEAVVKAWDADSEDYELVSGAIHSDTVIELCTDDPS